jgi:hypothetical protein
MSFDVDSFLNSTVSGANDTKLIPCPVGEYMGIISKVQPRQWQSKDGTTTGVALDVTWIIEDAGVKQLCNREEVQVRQGIMLDINPNGALDMGAGKNIGLGRLREAVGKNSPGEAFSFAMLPGLMAKVNVTHRPDERNPGDVFAEIRAVAKLG